MLKIISLQTGQPGNLLTVNFPIGGSSSSDGPSDSQDPVSPASRTPVSRISRIKKWFSSNKEAFVPEQSLDDCMKKINDGLDQLKSLKTKRAAISHIHKVLTNMEHALILVNKEDPKRAERLSRDIQLRKDELLRLHQELQHKSIRQVVDIIKYPLILGSTAAITALEVLEVSMSVGASCAAPGVSCAIDGVQLIRTGLKAKDLYAARDANIEEAILATGHLNVSIKKLKEFQRAPNILDANKELIENSIKHLSEIEHDLEKLNKGKSTLSAKKGSDTFDNLMRKVEALEDFVVKNNLKDNSDMRAIIENIHVAITAHLVALNYKRQAAELRFKMVENAVGIGTGVVVILAAASVVGIPVAIGVAVGGCLAKLGITLLHHHREKVTQKKAAAHNLDEKSTRRQLYRAALDHNAKALAESVIRCKRATPKAKFAGPDTKSLSVIGLEMRVGLGMSPFSERGDETDLSEAHLDKLANAIRNAPQTPPGARATIGGSGPVGATVMAS